MCSVHLTDSPQRVQENKQTNKQHLKQMQSYAANNSKQCREDNDEEEDKKKQATKNLGKFK
jgi:hypothetical protein